MGHNICAGQGLQNCEAGSVLGSMNAPFNGRAVQWPPINERAVQWPRPVEISYSQGRVLCVFGFY